MNNFSRYLKKKKSEMFFFIKDYSLAVLRFHNRCEIVDIATGELLTTLKVRAISEAVYCEKYNKLFLKSILNGCVYAYSFDTEELEKIFKLAESDKGIFLSNDESKLIAYSSGNVYEINTGTNECRLIYRDEIQCFYQMGWDNLSHNCYEFVFGSNTIPKTICQVSYNGELLSQAVIKIDNIPMQILDISYFSELDLYIMYGAKHYLMINQEPEDNDKELTVISKGTIGNIIYSSEHTYAGGCYYTLNYKGYLIYCCGNKNINVIDTRTLKEIKEVPLDKTITIMQYEPLRNSLYISTGFGCEILENFL